MAAHYNRSEAYDFELFQPKRQPEAPKKEKDNIIEIPRERLEENRRSRLHPVKALSSFLFLAVMLGIVSTLVYGQVRLTELTDGINTATKQLSESQSVYTQLKMKSEAQLSLDTVESYAETRLGMRKIEQNQVEYISLADGDKVQVLEPDGGTGWLESLTSILQGLVS